MDTLIKQTRKRRPASQDKNREVGSSTRDKKVPARRSVSFKEDKKKPSNWLQKQFSRQMSGESYDPIGDMDHAAAVAATAYAIANFEETWLESYHHSGLELGPSLPRSKSRREDELPLEEPRSSSKRFSEQLSFRDSEKKHERQRKQVSEPPRIQPPLRTRSERRAPPPPPPPPPLLSPPPLRLPPRETKRQSSGHTSRKDDSTADAWEKAELAKIKARYEKLNKKIDLWEAKKRNKARRKLDISEQSEVEQRRRRGLQKFRDDTEYIEQIAAGARAQAEKERQSKEFKVKEKAVVIRSTGKLPGKACCF